MVDALFDINADGGNQGFDAAASQVLTFQLRTRPSSAGSVRFQVWDAAGFDPKKDAVTNPPRKSKGAPDLSLVGASTGRSVSPSGGVNGTVSVTMPSTRGWGWLVRCVVDGGQTQLPDGRVVIDPTKIHQRMIVIRDTNGARPIIATETTEYEDDGWAGAFLSLTTGTPGATGPAGETVRSVQLPYVFSSETADADPGGGFLRLNGSESEEDSTALRVALVDSLGRDVTPTLDAAADRKGGIRLMKADDPSKWIAFSVSALASPSGYRNLTVAVRSSGKTDPDNPYNPFADGDALLLCFDRASEFHVDDFGGVSQPFIHNGAGITDGERSRNVGALQAVCNLARAVGAATVFLGAGWYYTNAAVGYKLTTDENLNVIFKGLGAGYTGINCNSHTEPAFWIQTTGGNLRFVFMQDIAIKGGREGLSLFWNAYSRYTRMRFWGSDNYTLQSQVGTRNVFDACSFDESATGALDGGTTKGDAVLLNQSQNEIVCSCNFAEFSGGIVVNGGAPLIAHCSFSDCTYRGRGFHDYATDTFVDPSATWLALVPSSIIATGGRLNVVGCVGGIFTTFIGAFRQYELSVSGCQIQSGAGSSGFINVWSDAQDTALNIGGGTTFVLLSGSGSNYFISNLGPVTLHDAVIEAQIVVYPDDTLTPLSSSAPHLLNPGSENNLVNLRTFIRTVF